MDDARWFAWSRPRTPRAQHSSTPLAVPAIAWTAFAWPELPEWWRSEYTVIAGVGLACLALAWMFAAFGSRASAGAEPPPRERARRALPTRRDRASDRLAFAPARQPSTTHAALHLVSGPTPERCLHGALVLAAELLERGERVLLVDAGRRLDLHEHFGRESRWGFGECMRGSLPLLGVVQDSGCPGLYLLARGSSGGAEQWGRLGALMDDARTHFGQVVLLVDPACPWAAGEAIKGRLIEGWWAEPGALPRASQALSERVGIPFHSLDLSSSPQELLERLWARPRALAPLSLPLAGVTNAELTLSIPVLETALARVRAPEPLVLDCDLRVRERLRFLRWTRQLGASAEVVGALSMAGAGSNA